MQPRLLWNFVSGVSSPDGTDMLSVATKAINDIRERAGARLLTASLTGTTDSRDIVRKERRKELASNIRPNGTCVAGV